MPQTAPPSRYEHVSQPLLHWPHFVRRLLRSVATGTLIIGLSLFIGMLGYRFIVGMPWVDAYENAAMILSGMGPLSAPATTSGKIFAGSYALFSGLVVVITVGIVFAPMVHRFLHRLHADAS
jgi:hypothetical protein